jgi:hypothetical protein
MKRTSLLLAIVLIIGGTPGVAGAQDISPWLIGQNHWLADGDEGRTGYLHLLWPRVAESGVRLVRIGGNGYEHSFPDRERLGAMVRAIRGIGAEPLLQVPRSFSGAQAAELVRSFNASAPGTVRFWSIGNEPLLREPDIIDQVHEYLVRIATAMKEADPTIRIFVFDECEMRAAAFEALCGGRLDVTGTKANGAWLIDGFTFHRYPNGEEFSREDVVLRSPGDIRGQAEELVAMMKKADATHGRTGEDRLRWALTEVNVTYRNPDRDADGFGNASFLGGQFLAEVFGIGMELDAFTVAPWCISETDRVETDFGYVGLPPAFHPRSTYYHTQMMARHLVGRFVASSTNDNHVKSIASRSDRALVVMVLNESVDRDLDFAIVSRGDATSTKPLVVTVDAALAESHQGRLPAQTTVMLVLDAEGQPLLRYTYGLRHNQGNLPPEVKQF